MGKFILNVRAFVGEMEREKFKERSSRGNLARLQSGKMRPSNRPLYGYQWDDPTRKMKGAYIVDVDKAAIVRRIFNEVASGKTLRKIAEGLTLAGIPTANGAARWHHEVVRGMCAHQAYMGVAIANRYTSVEVNNKRHKIERPLEEHITLPEGTIPAIVTPEVFAAVQEKLTRNKIQAARNNRDPETFLLRAGFILCGYCGKKVHTAHHKKRDGSLRPAYAVMTNSAEHEACPAFSMSAPILDAVVWERVKELMQEGGIERELARLEEQPDTTALEEQAVQRMRETNTKQITNLSRALGMLDDAEAQTPILMQIRDLTERNHAL